MRKDPNMLLRGTTWWLRVTVPKRLQDLRAEQGIRSSKEVWKTLRTGDYPAAKVQATHVKAAIFRGFEEEERRCLARPVPSLPQLQQAASEFGSLVQTSLANERLLEAPSAAEVEAAIEARNGVAQALDAASKTSQVQSLTIRYFDFDSTIHGLEDMLEARRMLRDRLWRELQAQDYVSVEPFVSQAARFRGYRIEPNSREHRQLAHLLLKAWIQALDDAPEAFLRLDEPLRDQDEALAGWASPRLVDATPEPAPVVSPAQPIPPERDIRVLFQTYLSEKFPKMPPNAVADRNRTIQQFVEVVGLKEVSQYRKVDMTAFKGELMKLPINATREFPGLTMREATQAAPASSKRLAPKTVKSRLSIMGSFGRWLSENVDGVDDANFRTSAPLVRKPEQQVKEFNDADVKAILLSTAFTGCGSERNQQVVGTYSIRDYRYWLPMLAAYSGCRLNELTQLRVVDVVQVDGIWALNITDAGDGQSLKTKASKRLVPVHSALIAAGFIQYVQKLRNQDREALFGDIPIGRDGRRSEAAGRQFRKYLTRIGVKTAGVRGGIHRFRHTVVQKLRDAGHSDLEIGLIVGHETALSTMTASYGSSKQMLVRQRSLVLESLSYEGVEFGYEARGP